MPADWFVAMVAERLKSLNVEFPGEEDVVSDLWVSIERQVIPEKVDAIFQEESESVFQDPFDDPGKPFPDEAVMGDNHL
jgi:hypothetical protein